MSPTNKVGCGASRNKLVEKSGVLDMVKNLGKFDSSKDCPRAMLGFVAPIRNGLRNIKNTIEGLPTRRKLAWQRERIDLRLQKEE